MRLLGKVLFVLYIGFIIYFLLFSDLYGRTGVMEEYRYNLVLFKEIKRFWQYREQLGWYAMFTNLFGNVIIFMPFGFFLPMASKYRSFFAAVFYSFTLSLCVEDVYKRQVYDFAEELKDIVPEVHMVGDAVRARRALDATKEAYDVALKL